MSAGKYRWEGASVPAFRMCYSENLKVMLPHSHSEIEFMYFYSTSGCTYKCGGKTLLLQTGDLVAVEPGVVHSCDQWGEPCSAVCMVIDMKKLHTPLLSGLCFAGHIRADGALAALFEEMKEALLDEKTSGAERECRISSLVYRFLGMASRYAQHRKNVPPRAAELALVTEHIEKNLSEELSVADLARLLCLSVSRFSHVFREHTGMSPTDYITARRIEKACGYLADTDMTVAEIAQACHFCTSSYFCEKFRDYMKMTPLEYRRDPLTAFGR